MSLVDTSVWVDHRRRPERDLIGRHHEGEVLTHAVIIRRTACSNLDHRCDLTREWQALLQIPELPHADVLADIEFLDLVGKGVATVWGSWTGTMARPPILQLPSSAARARATMPARHLAASMAPLAGDIDAALVREFPGNDGRGIHVAEGCGDDQVEVPVGQIARMDSPMTSPGTFSTWAVAMPATVRSRWRRPSFRCGHGPSHRQQLTLRGQGPREPSTGSDGRKPVCSPPLPWGMVEPLAGGGITQLVGSVEEGEDDQWQGRLFVGSFLGGEPVTPRWLLLDWPFRRNGLEGMSGSCIGSARGSTRRATGKSSANRECGDAIDSAAPRTNRCGFGFVDMNSRQDGTKGPIGSDEANPVPGNRRRGLCRASSNGLPSSTCLCSTPTTRAGYECAMALPELTVAPRVSGCAIPANRVLSKAVHSYWSRRTRPGGLSSPVPFSS